MDNPWINITKPEQDVRTQRVSADHPIELFYGKSPSGSYMFLYRAEHGVTIELPDRINFGALEYKTFNHSGHDFLVLELSETADWELFASLCRDLEVATKELSKDDTLVVATIIRRLKRWQDFLKREKNRLLSPEAQKGLLAELLFLKQELVPTFDWEDSVSFWKGPLGAPQDFAVHDTGVEIKCQAGATTPFVRINGLDQLDCQLSKLYLSVFTISSGDSSDPDSISLYRLVNSIRAELLGANDLTRESFEDALMQVGYHDSEEYDKKYYKEISQKVYEVRDEFPRLTREDVSEGIDKVGYSIELYACSSYQCEIQW